MHWRGVAKWLFAWAPVGVATVSVGGSVHRLPSAAEEEANGKPIARYVWVYKFSAKVRHQHNRGDIVWFTSPVDPTQACMKRLMAVQDDWVAYTDVHNDHTKTYSCVPKGRCWVEAEEENASSVQSLAKWTKAGVDSMEYGAIPAALIQGKVVGLVWPPSEWQLFPNKIAVDRLL